MVELTIHHTHCWTIAQPTEYKISLTNCSNTSTNKKKFYLGKYIYYKFLSDCFFMCILYIISSMPISDSEEENKREEMLKNQDTKSKFNEMNVEFENSWYIRIRFFLWSYFIFSRFLFLCGTFSLRGWCDERSEEDIF